MKINSINCGYEYYQVEETTIEVRKKDYQITKIDECDKVDGKLGTNFHGFALYSNKIVIGFVPYDAVTLITYEVENVD